MPRKKKQTNKVYVELYESPLQTKKYRAIFKRNGVEFRHTDFGAKGMDDYTMHQDKDRKQNFLSRFEKLIKKERYNPYSPMTLSTMLLWNKPTLRASWNDYKRRFKMK